MSSAWVVAVISLCDDSDDSDDSTIIISLLLPGSPWACSGNVWAFVCTFLVVPLVLLAESQ